MGHEQKSAETFASYLHRHIVNKDHWMISLTLPDGYTVAPFISMYISSFTLVPRSIIWNLEGLPIMFDSNHFSA